MKIDLLGQPGDEPEAAPGRIIACDPALPFEFLANAINAAFGRWGLIDDYEFFLAGGDRVVGHSRTDEAIVEEGAALLVGEELGMGETFRYMYHSEVSWTHACEVFPEPTDPTYGGLAQVDDDYLVEWGWGDVPDQAFHQNWDPRAFSEQVLPAGDPSSEFS